MTLAELPQSLEPASVWTVLIALITLATLIVNTIGNRRSTSNAIEAKSTAGDAKVAAETAAAQLTNNGGSTALDKLQLGQLATQNQISELAGEVKIVGRSVLELHTRVETIESGLNTTKEDTPS